MSTTTPAMGLVSPTIGTDSGLVWEQSVNANNNTVDGHDHTPGKGVQVPPSGLNINSDLPVQSNNITQIRAARFTPQGSPIPNTGADVGEVYVSGNELFYNDVSGGNQVQITNAGNVNVTSSGISSGTASAAFSGSTLVVKSSSTSFANVDVQSIILANSGNLSNQLTLQAPTLSTSIVETLPLPPASATSIMQMDTSGNMSAVLTVDGSTIVKTSNVLGVGAGSIGPTQLVTTPITSATQISSGVIIGGAFGNLAAGTVSVSNMASTVSWSNFTSGSQSFTSGTHTLLQITSFQPVVARPLLYSFSGNNVTPSNTGTILMPGSTAVSFSIVAGLNTIATMCIDNSGSAASYSLPISVLNQMISGVNVGSTHTTELILTFISGSGSVGFTQFFLVVSQI